MHIKSKSKTLNILKKLINNFSITSKYLRKKIINLLIISIITAVFESITLVTLYLFVSSYTKSQVNSNFFVEFIQNIFDKSYLGIIIIISLIMITFLKIYVNKLQNKLGCLMASEIGGKYMSKVLDEGIQNTTKENYDQIISVLNTDIANVTTVYQSLFGCFLAILSAFSICITLFSISGIKTIFGILIIVIFYLTSFKTINKDLKNNGKKFTFLNQKSISFSRSILENLRIILLDNKRNLFENYFAESYKQSKLVAANISTSYQSPKFLIEGLVYISIISIIILVEYDFLGFINISELIGFTYGILRLVQPSQLIFNFISNLVSISSQLDRINSKLFVENNFRKSIKRKSKDSYKINFDSKYIKYSLKNISHKFDNSNKYIIKNISFDFYNGQKICMTGKSGSGKSTLADILCCLLLPSKGNISINDINLPENNKDLEKWKSRISYIPQNFSMISDKIIENIIFNKDDISFDKERIKACIKAAQIDYLSDFKNNIESSRIANKLSGGQKQRVNIARGLYKDASLYVFDEITSSLDVLTKKAIISSIFNFLNSKTIFMITHDLSYLDLFDKIIFLENGRIEAEGKYEYLIENSIKFRKYLKQNKNYKNLD